MLKDKFFLYWLNQPAVREAISLMYKRGEIERWNPISGCCYTCVYCWARRLALTKLKNTPRYKDGFKPRLNERDLKRKFKHPIVFVGFMSDMWGDCIPDSWIERVLEHLESYDNGRHLFFFLTKNPARYRDFLHLLPENSYIGTTIETNRDEYFYDGKISNAPLPSERYRSFKGVRWHWKNVTLEPIMDFDMETIVKWIGRIDPVLVFLGYDSFRLGLPEPPLSKTVHLIKTLEKEYFVLYKNLRKSVEPTLYRKLVDNRDGH